MKQQTIHVDGVEIILFSRKEEDYISLTDIARYKNPKEAGQVIANWLRKRFTIDFMGIWERVNNPHFKVLDFEYFKNKCGENSFTLSVTEWVQKTKAIGIFSKLGRYGGGTFAHKDIAFEFASWISPEFKYYLIKEFQRLKEGEHKRNGLEWNVGRALTKINYKIHSDAIEKYLIPAKLTSNEISKVYANEADILNKVLFGQTATQWRKSNPKKQGNIRDYATVMQLVCLANLESLNAEFIRQGSNQRERLVRLNEIAIVQMTSLLSSGSLKKLEKGK